MRKTGHHGSKLGPSIHHRSKEQGDEEQHKQEHSVPGDGSDGNDGDTDERAGRDFIADGERFDEHVGDDEDDGQADRQDNLSEEYIPPAGSWNVAGQLLGGVAQLLLLVTGNHRS